VKPRIAIVGAGISGLSAAQMLKNEADVTVFEKEPGSGGLIRCKNVNGNLFHVTGGHVFNSKNRDVLNWFYSYFNVTTDFIKATRNSAIWLQNQFVGYPIESNLRQLNETLVNAIMDDLFHLINEPAKLATFEQICKTYNNFGNFLEKRFGTTLYELYFKPYNEKIWNRNLYQIPLEWLEGKLPMPDIKTILMQNVLQKQESEMVHATFYYPRKGGSQFIIDTLASDILVEYNTEIKTISQTPAGLLINNKYYFDEIIYTGDIRQMGALLKMPELDNYTKNFMSNATTNALCTIDNLPYSWLYLPDKALLAHRIIFTGNFSPANNANALTCVVEFSGTHTQETILNELEKLPGNPKLIEMHHTPASYIIHSFETAGITDKIQEILVDKNIYLLGRFAQWQYFNMDKCIESAMQVSSQIIKKYR